MAKPQTLELPITGMHCASCASRLESTLCGLNGIQEASVSFPTEKAIVAYDPSILADSNVVDAIRSIGFDVSLPSEDDQPNDAAEAIRKANIQRQYRMLLVGSVLTIPLFILSMGRDFGLY